MFLQLALLSFAVQWLGSPWQLGPGKAILACLLFIIVIFLSAMPAMYREWGNIKSALLIYIVIQILCLILCIFIPGIGQVFAILFNIYLMFRPVSFYKNIGSGFIIFFIWFIGLNHILGRFILTDPRGVFSGNLYLSATSWVILIIFIAAIVRAVYHAIISFKVSFLKPDTENKDNKSNIVEDIIKKDTQTDNAALQKKEKKTLFPLLIVSVIAIAVSLLFQPSWRGQAINDLKNAFAAVSNNDYKTAQTIAEKYHNEKKILYNGDVFYLNALVAGTQQETVQFYNKAANWYDNHSSWINEDYHGQVYYRLSMIYLNENPPDYYRARNAIEKAVKANPDNSFYRNLYFQIRENVTRFEEQEKIGFLRRFWNNLRVRF